MTADNRGGITLTTKRPVNFGAPESPPVPRDFTLWLEDGCIVGRAPLNERGQKLAEFFFMLAEFSDDQQSLLDWIVPDEAPVDWSPQLFAEAFERLWEHEMPFYLIQAANLDCDQGTLDGWPFGTMRSAEAVLSHFEADCDCQSQPLDTSVPLEQWWVPMTAEQRAVRKEAVMAALRLDGEAAIAKYKAYGAMCTGDERAFKTEYGGAMQLAKRRAAELQLEQLPEPEQDAAHQQLNHQVLAEFGLPLPPWAAEVSA